MFKINKFIADRDNASLSLNRKKILAYCKKYRIRRFEDCDEKTFWIAVHRARIQILDFPLIEKEHSRKWLRDNGYKEEV